MNAILLNIAQQNLHPDTQEAVEAGRKSARSGRMVRVPMSEGTLHFMSRQQATADPAGYARSLAR